MKLIFFKKAVVGMIVGVAISALLLLVFAAVLSGQEDPTTLMNAFSIISLIAGAIVCGKVSAIGVEHKLAQGVVSGGALALVILLPSVLMSDFGGMSIVKMLLTVVLSVAGAMVGKKSTVRAASAKRRKNVMKRYAG